MKLCKVAGGEEEPEARGWCQRHDDNQWRNGDPLTEETWRERFEFYARPGAGPADCWEWEGEHDPDGAALIWVDGCSRYARFSSWIIYNGPVPKGRNIYQACEDKGCVNPEHLAAFTIAEHWQLPR